MKVIKLTIKVDVIQHNIIQPISWTFWTNIVKTIVAKWNVSNGGTHLAGHQIQEFKTKFPTDYSFSGQLTAALSRMEEQPGRYERKRKKEKKSSWTLT